MKPKTPANKKPTQAVKRPDARKAANMRPLTANELIANAKATLRDRKSSTASCAVAARFLMDKHEWSITRVASHMFAGGHPNIRINQVSGI